MGGVSEHEKIFRIMAWIFIFYCYSYIYLLVAAAPDVTSTNQIHVHLHIIPHSHVDPMWKSSPHEYSKSTNKILEGVVLSLIQNPNRTFIWESIFFLDIFLASHGSQNICDLFSQLEQKETNKWCHKHSPIYPHSSSPCCSMKEAVVKLLSLGQLELVGGGWVSHDETLTDFESKLDNYAVGRHWISRNLGTQ
jgi:hypothetical protein